MHTNFALNELAQLYFGSISSLDFDSGAVNVVEQASQDLWLRVDTLDVNSNKRTVENLGVLNHYSVVPFRYDVHASLGKL